MSMPTSFVVVFFMLSLSVSNADVRVDSCFAGVVAVVDLVVISRLGLVDGGGENYRPSPATYIPTYCLCLFMPIFS
ncbi:hypothetical protein B0J18DRAFT_184314 [Chaetomium sp. MPI-SDFR-AT-0129]|nr:hypothetical protein B0J18DRAFT_184314 [Chaetomium sp. MPI-SDFR-AT-0129]